MPVNISELLFLLTFGLLIVVALALFLPSLRSRTHTGSTTNQYISGPIDRTDDRYWFAGVFYNNPDDPDPFVPKRFSIGWTVNFGHPLGKLLAALMIFMLLLPVALALFFPGFAASGCHPSGCHLLP
jgi:uncharacterized membrane protein